MISRTRRPYTLADWSSANDMAQRYRTLAKHAEDLGLEAETDALHRTAGEYDNEADDIFVDLVERGIEP